MHEHQRAVLAWIEVEEYRPIKLFFFFLNIELLYGMSS